MLRATLLIITLFGSLLAVSQKTLTAVKALHPPVIGGQLQDSVWQASPLLGNFIQNYPDFGKPALASSNVQVLYDDAAFYVRAYLKDDPQLVRRQLTARDGEVRQDVDYFGVAFDTYNDHQNGFLFLVTAANVQTDAKLDADAGMEFGYIEADRTWDAVWQSSVHHQADGWVVQMRVPYLSLRFAKKDLQTWGLQFIRFTRRNNEASTWNPVNPVESGFINQFGKCHGLRDIKPPLRLSLSPYVTAGLRTYPEGSATDKEFLRNGGMDVKYGINESFTLDATLIPDFGQVVSDNLVNNLTPFEIQFRENRPFFTEGIELFSKADLFYSRRVGAVPGKYYATNDLGDDGSDLYTIKKNPSVTQLYNAIKLSGRTRNKLGIGLFNAITAPMEAELRNRVTGRDSTIQTEPLTNYNLIVLDQALKGRSSITFTNSNVIRSGAARDANVSALDLSLFTKNNQYQLWLSGRYSNIFGYTPYYGNINLADDTVRMNNVLMVKPYDGYAATVGFSKVSGNLQFETEVNVESDRYDPNDLGYLQNPNEVKYSASLYYNQLTPTNKFLRYGYELNISHAYLYKPYAFDQFEINGRGEWLFKNFWDLNAGAGTQPVEQRDYFELRTPGRYLRRPTFWYVGIGGGTDSRKKLYVRTQLSYAHSSVEGGKYYETSSEIRYRFSNRFTARVSAATLHDETQIGYAFVPNVNGQPVVGYRRYFQTESILSGIYSFTARLNLTLRARHYWNEVRYKRFFTAANDGYLMPIAFIPNNDENYNLFNLDGFLTWDFRPGSRFIVGYKNWLGNPYSVLGQRNYFGNLKGIFTGSHGNELTVKFIYFLDYNQLRKKK